KPWRKEGARASCAYPTLPRRACTAETIAVALVRFQKAHSPGGAAGLEAFIGFLLFLGGNNGLTCVAALPDPGPGDELGAAPAALLRHRLLEREDAGLLGQKMGIVEV